MEKQKFFDNIHEELAERFNVDSSVVKFIRSNYLGHGESKEELLFHCHKDIRETNSPKRKRHRSEAVSLILNLSDEEFQEVVKKTKYDK